MLKARPSQSPKLHLFGVIETGQTQIINAASKKKISHTLNRGFGGSGFGFFFVSQGQEMATQTQRSLNADATEVSTPRQQPSANTQPEWDESPRNQQNEVSY